MITTHDELGLEIFNYLKSKLNIPESVISLNLSLGVDEALVIDCKYYANAKAEIFDK